jgi:hypothetical protein
MADPITAGVVASSLMPTVGAATAASIPALAGAGALAAPFAAAPTITSALNTGLATGGGMGGGTLFGFDPTIGGFGQGITEALKAPLFGQGGTLSNVGQAAGAYNQVNQLLGGQQQQMQMPGAMQVQRGQIQPMDYASLLNPQNQTVIRPPQISLLG